MNRLVCIAALLLPALAFGADLAVTDVTLCAGEVCGLRFETGAERLDLTLRIDNPGPPTTLYVEWRRAGKRLNTRDLPVETGSGLYRRIRRGIPADGAGDWSIVLYNGRRRQMQSIPFTIGGGDAAPPADPAVAEATPAPNALPSDQAASPAEAPSDSRATPAPIAPPRGPARGPCRALVGLALGDGRYETAEVAIDAEPRGETAPGLVLRAGGRAFAVRVVTHRQEGQPHRRWEQIWGVALDRPGEPRPWHGYPLPHDPRAQAPRLTHRLEILQTFGPFVSVRASFAGIGPDDAPVARARFITLRAPGDVVDPTALVSEVDRLGFARHVLGRSLDPLARSKRVDLRQSVLWLRGSRTVLATLTGDPQDTRVWPVTPPPDLRPPDALGFFGAPDACGAVGLDRGRLTARGPGGTDAVGGVSGPYAAVLGVSWLADEPSLLPALRRAFDSEGALAETQP